MRWFLEVTLTLIAVLLLMRGPGLRPADPPLPTAPGGRPDAYLTIPKLSIVHAPIWSRGLVATAAGAVGLAVVPAYGVTRLVGGAPFGQPGLTLLYGYDSAHGAIFHWLSALEPAHLRDQPPFPGDEVQVQEGPRLFRYYVRHKLITGPANTSILDQTYHRPTLVLLSSTPYRVDTLRVFIVAQR